MGKPPFLATDKPFTYPGFLEKLKFFQGTGMTIVALKKPVDFPEEATHAHNNYEFVFPVISLECWIGERKIHLEENKLIPINSEQEHGPARQFAGCNFLSIEIEKEFMSQLARSIYGKSEVLFKNKNYAYDNIFKCLANQFIMEYENQQAGREFILESLATQFTVNILRHLKSNLPVSLSTRNYYEKENINRVIDYLMENYTQEYSLEEVAQLANLSPYYFIKVFKTQTGKTPYDFLVDIKINKACNLLKTSSNTITEICGYCGFSNSSHFTNIFKKKMGVSPSEYRKAFILR